MIELRRCVTEGCKAYTTDHWCKRCQDALLKRPAEHAFDAAAQVLEAHPEMPVDLALLTGELEAKLLYGDGRVQTPAKGLLRS